MPRLDRSAVLLSLVMLALPACRASKAELAAIQGQLTAIQSNQVAIQGEQAQLREQLTAIERTEVDRAARRELVGIAVRVAALEDKLTELQERTKPSPAARRPDPALVYKVELGDSPVRGSSKALVTIVMWTDYQCPFCARVQVTMDKLAEIYGSDVRFVHKHNPLAFHPQAMPAALAAEAARRQGKFWEMHDRLFDNPKELTDDNFRKWAKKIGLSVRRFSDDLEDPELRQRIERDQAQGDRLGARGTPAFFINGRFMSGAHPVESFRVLIDEELDKARRLVDRGVPRTRVYDTVIEEGKTSL